MILTVKNTLTTIKALRDLGISILPESSYEIINPDYEIAASNDLILSIALGELIANNGEKDLSATDAIKYILGRSIEPRDWTGKLFYHPTVRPFGTKVHFTGAGDAIEVISDIGGGADAQFFHSVGDPLEETLYIDFNTINNVTHIQEGNLQWITAFFDKITVEFVPRIELIITGENTSYLYTPIQPIILPAELGGGNGNVEIVDELQVPKTPQNLIQALPNEKGVKPPAYWNADYNSETGLFENLTSAVNGDGNYNIFHMEYAIARFANRVGMLGSNVLHFNTDDSDPIPHGSRARLIFETYGDDHEWGVLLNLKLHREKSC